MRSLAGVALGAVAARAAYAALKRRPPRGREPWERTNFRGETLTLLEGPALALGASAAVAASPGVPGRTRAAALLAGVGCGALGAYDDLAGSGYSRGFKGHLGALTRGEVTTGAVKILGIGATGLLAATLAPRGTPSAITGKGFAGETAGWAGKILPRNRGSAGCLLGRAAGTLADGALVAGSANLMNLFDLRPGRAAKVGLLTGVPAALAGGPGGAVAAPAVGAAAALLPEDLGERAMLGDAGANALGALLGLAAVTGLSRRGRTVALGGVVALTAASEFVSFTKVIAGTPFLDRLDQLGRRPAPRTTPATAAPAPLANGDPASPAGPGSGSGSAGAGVGETPGEGPGNRAGSESALAGPAGSPADAAGGLGGLGGFAGDGPGGSGAGSGGGGCARPRAS